MSRGRLIYSFLASLCRLGDRGERDDDFKEQARIELSPVRIPCQVEPDALDELRLFDTGASPRLRVVLVFHFRHLERLGLVDARTGAPLLGPGDRLDALYDRAGALVQSFPVPPGLYVTDLRASGFGLGTRRPRRNLLLAVFEDRQQATGRPQ